MKYFADSRSKRPTALVVLLLWLFALASGVANACLLETPGLHSSSHSNPHANPHANAAQAPAHEASHAHPQPPGDRANAAGNSDPDASKQACLKACDDGTRTAPKAYASVEQVDPGPPPLVTTLWVARAHAAPAPDRLEVLAVPIVGPPLRVRYSRLAL